MSSISGLDYSTSRCQSIDINDVKRKDHLKDIAGVNYFEKICLRCNQFHANYIFYGFLIVFCFCFI